MAQPRLIHILAMIAAMLFWGIAWTAGKVAAEHADAHVAAFWRYAIAFMAMIPVVFWLKTAFKTDRIGLLYMIGAGLLTALFNWLFFAGLAAGRAGYGGTLVTSLSPIVTYALSLLLFRFQVTAAQILGLSAGFAGALVLLRVPYEGLAFLTPESLFFIGCAVVWAVVTIFSQQALKRSDPLFYSLVVFAVAAGTNLVFALPYAPFDFAAYDAVFWWTIVFIGLVPGMFSTTLFFLFSGKIGAHKTGIYMFIVPVGATLSAWVVYGERLEPSTIFGCALAFGAVALFGLKSRKKSTVA